MALTRARLRTGSSRAVSTGGATRLALPAPGSMRLRGAITTLALRGASTRAALHVAATRARPRAETPLVRPHVALEFVGAGAAVVVLSPTPAAIYEVALNGRWLRQVPSGPVLNEFMFAAGILTLWRARLAGEVLSVDVIGAEHASVAHTHREPEEFAGPGGPTFSLSYTPSGTVRCNFGGRKLRRSIAPLALNEFSQVGDDVTLWRSLNAGEILIVHGETEP